MKISKVREKFTAFLKEYKYVIIPCSISFIILMIYCIEKIIRSFMVILATTGVCRKAFIQTVNLVSLNSIHNPLEDIFTHLYYLLFEK